MTHLSSVRAFAASSLLTLTLAVPGCAESILEEERGSSVSKAVDHSASGELRTAAERKDAADERYSRAFGRVGNMLTTPQQKAFTAAFYGIPEIAAIETNYRARTAALASTLEKASKDEASITAYNAGFLEQDFELLAKTPSAMVALKFAARVLAREIDVNVTDEYLYDAIIGPALGMAFVAKVTETGSADAALKAIGDVLQNGSEKLSLLGGALESYNAFAKVDTLDRAVGIKSEPTLRSLHGIAGLVALFQVGHAYADSSAAAEKLRVYLESGPEAISGVSDGLGLLQRMVRGSESKTLANMTRWAGNVGAVFGGLLAAFDQLRVGGTWADTNANKAKTIANLVSIAASVAAFTPFGGAAAVVAFGVNMLADYLGYLEMEATTKSDLRACLGDKSMKLSPALVTLMAESARPELIDALVNKVGLGPTDIQWLATTFPASISEVNLPAIRTGYDRFANLRLRFDLDAAESIALLRQVAGTPNPDDSLFAFLGCLSGTEIHDTTAKASVLSELRFCGGSLDEGKPGLDAGLAYLSQK